MRRLGIGAVIAVALITLTACGDDTPRCAAPLVAVDHGHSVTNYMPIRVGKVTVMSPHTTWRSNWQCEEKSAA